MSNYSNYKSTTIEGIKDCLETMECQPILFVGSGISKRYFGAPTWPELLEKLTELNPCSREFAYYKQINRNNIDIGTEVSNSYTEWAWGEGRSTFKEELFSPENLSSIFMKSKVADILTELTPTSMSDIADKHLQEIKLLQEIRPHSIITTNYDQFIEMVFPEYTSIVGQQILKSQYSSIGEIFKIHGCVSEPSSLVLNREDYNDFLSKKKYLSAKLLTFFLEHPIIFLGYGAGDPNIQAILSDIDEILSSDNQLVPNIYIVQWEENIEETNTYSTETLIKLEGEKSIRIKSISAENYGWIYESLLNENAIEKVNPKLLRALLARTYKLVRTDIPKRTIEIDYGTLQHALEGNEEINKIYGITTLNTPGAFNINYPFTISEIAKTLGYNNWYYVNKLILKIAEEKGINLKESDNKYHTSIKTGTDTVTRKYSQDFVDLIIKVKNDEYYEIQI
jgi:hypothetical protein